MQNLDDEVAESHFLLTALGCSVPPYAVDSNIRQESRGVEHTIDLQTCHGGEMQWKLARPRHLLELTLEVFRLRHTEEEENPNIEGLCGRRGCPETRDWWVLMVERLLGSVPGLKTLDCTMVRQPWAFEMRFVCQSDCCIAGLAWLIVWLGGKNIPHKGAKSGSVVADMLNLQERSGGEAGHQTRSRLE